MTFAFVIFILQRLIMLFPNDFLRLPLILKGAKKINFHPLGMGQKKLIFYYFLTQNPIEFPPSTGKTTPVI